MLKDDEVDQVHDISRETASHDEMVEVIGHKKIEDEEDSSEQEMLGSRKKSFDMDTIRRKRYFE